MRRAILIVGVDQFCGDVSPNAPLVNVYNNVIGTTAFCLVSCAVDSGLLSTWHTESLGKSHVASITSIDDPVDPPAAQALFLPACILKGDVVAIGVAFGDRHGTLG